MRTVDEAWDEFIGKAQENRREYTPDRASKIAFQAGWLAHTLALVDEDVARLRAILRERIE